jgi:hypothetical protein
MQISKLLVVATMALATAAFTPCTSAGLFAKPAQKVCFIGDATAQSVKGTVEWQDEGGAWHPVKKGARLPQGTVLRTGTKGNLVLRMRQSGSLVRLSPRTLARLRGLQGPEDPSILTGVDPEPEGFVIRSIRGDASVRENGKWVPLKVNGIIKEGSVIKTGPESTMDLFSREAGVVIRLFPSSVLVLDPTPLLEAGHLESNSRKFLQALRQPGDQKTEHLAVAQ